MSARWILVRHAPTLAGGPLLLLNRVLQACACARERGGGARAVLLLDENLLRARDRALLFLNAFGDPVALAGPGNGRCSAGERAALAAAARDRLPSAAGVEPALERLLPPADTDPLEAESGLWRSLLAGAGLEVWTRRAGEPLPPAPAALLGPPAPEWPGAEPLEPRPLTWFGPRQLQLLRQLRIAPADALRGEEFLRAAATPRQATGTLQAGRALRDELDRRLAELERAVQAEDVSLLGTWSRLRRQTRAASRDFLLRAERNARNHQGIRGARLHALAQALRPLDQPQEEHLGLLCAAALFELDLGRLEQAVEGVRAAREPWMEATSLLPLAAE